MVGERDYSRLDPSGLQGELIELYRQLPDSLANMFILQDGELPDGALVEIRRRQEGKQLTMQKLEHLLQFSQVTDFLRGMILSNFDIFYQMGVSKRGEKSETSFFDLILEIDNPVGEGVFEPVRARQIEFAVYRFVTRRVIGIRDSGEALLIGQRSLDDVKKNGGVKLLQSTVMSREGLSKGAQEVKMR